MEENDRARQTLPAAGFFSFACSLRVNSIRLP
jgi:hypothetical protein